MESKHCIGTIWVVNFQYGEKSSTNLTDFVLCSKFCIFQTKIHYLFVNLVSIECMSNSCPCLSKEDFSFNIPEQKQNTTMTDHKSLNIRVFSSHCLDFVKRVSIYWYLLLAPFLLFFQVFDIWKQEKQKCELQQVLVKRKQDLGNLNTNMTMIE